VAEGELVRPTPKPGGALGRAGEIYPRTSAAAGREERTRLTEPMINTGHDQKARWSFPRRPRHWLPLWSTSGRPGRLSAGVAVIGW